MTAGPFEVIFILVLIMGNGFLAMSEIAIVSARKAPRQSRAAGGSKRYQTAVELANSPGNFLSTVQIGITLVGILAGAVGEAALADELEHWLISIGVGQATSEVLGVGVVVLIITYLSLILGELAPKQIGLLHAEKVAAAVAPIIHVLSIITRPFVWLLSLTTRFVLRVLGIHPSDEPSITEEEVKVLIDQGTALGVFEPVEDVIVDQVFRMSDQKVVSITIPRGEIIWLDTEDAPEENYKKMAKSNYSIYPVAKGDLDNMLGFVRSHELLAQSLAGKPIDLNAAIHPPLYLPENMPVFEALKRFRETGDEFAFVIEEHGGVQGIVTLQDILESLVEDLPSREESEHPSAQRRADDSWLVDGTIQIDEFRELFGLHEFPGEVQGYYHTLGGFIMTVLGEVPDEGDGLDWQDLHIEVIDMDGRRVDKVLVIPQKSVRSNLKNPPKEHLKP